MVKRDLISPNRIFAQIHHDFDTLRDRVKDFQNTYECKVARIGTMSYRCLTRIHQLLISFIFYINSDVFQLNYEYRTIEQLKFPNKMVESTDIWNLYYFEYTFY